MFAREVLAGAALGDIPANTDPSHQPENLDRILTLCSNPDCVSGTSHAESLVHAPSPLCARGSTVQTIPYLLGAPGSVLLKLAQLSVAGCCSPPTPRLLGNTAWLPLPKRGESKGAFAFPITPPHPMDVALCDHGGLHLRGVLSGERKGRPCRWGLSIRGASCECAYTGAGGEQA